MDRELAKMRFTERHHSHRSHTRSRSPTRPSSSPRGSHRDRSRSRRHHRRSSRSPARNSRHGERHGERKSRHHGERRELSPVSAAPPVLPYNARQLSKRDLSTLEPMFAMYLDIQKGLVLEDMDEKEVMGRWKSFIKKWNRGELAEGWYDPATFEKAKGSLDNTRTARDRNMIKLSRSSERPSSNDDTPDYRRNDVPMAANDDDDDDEDYGPKLPSGAVASRGPLSGPTIPNLQDLELQHEQARADAEAARSEAHAHYKQEALSHKKHLRAFEDEVAPRAEPGTHERKMEKKREKAAANREFASGRRGGSPTMDDAPDSELMGGGGDDDLSELKKAKEQETRKKNEREMRREEILRAKKVEREERLGEYKKKEEETMGWLKALAKQRFG
ncbi:conserved hypothetical protein [Talaromyces stipitatus ATCC 10500]|uniref:RNA helicase HEL117 n=1 Tax=Talaromyces stipitatus (strain ATCC 10500 / CBS 375.48 / QM 6759 / NRRL 1006) TaxID=441959 RepID=B8M7I2_TALSN|nr:uncharacterized protein TSTA_028240 [Talaromyces stipitatus ATCC 10500]EED19535.1 conserved hypothetical protein [Talaromyces stipitatus ATCC 10500]